MGYECLEAIEPRLVGDPESDRRIGAEVETVKTPDRTKKYMFRNIFSQNLKKSHETVINLCFIDPCTVLLGRSAKQRGGEVDELKTARSLPDGGRHQNGRGIRMQRFAISRDAGRYALEKRPAVKRAAGSRQRQRECHRRIRQHLDDHVVIVEASANSRAVTVDDEVVVVEQRDGGTSLGSGVDDVERVDERGEPIVVGDRVDVLE